MGGIRTNAAAELLGVSPNTLRSWERRFGYPKPARTAGGHRQYELAELEGLRQGLLETHNISSAIQVARQRGEGFGSLQCLSEALGRVDFGAGDRVMEASLAVRSVDRTVQDLLLPAVESLYERGGHSPEYEVAHRWAAGWLSAARRALPAPLLRGVLLCDSAPALDPEALHVLAFDLALRRLGFQPRILSLVLHSDRIGRAARVFDPAAVVFCGVACLDDVGRCVYHLRGAGFEGPVVQHRDAVAVGSRKQTIATLGSKACESASNLKVMLDAAASPRGQAVRTPQHQSTHAPELAPELVHAAA